MESDTEDNHKILHNMQIDPSRSRFPCCIVWTPLPVVSWLLPFVGHIGICRQDGVILDFAGPNFVCVDNFTFGAVTRYIQINKSKCAITEEDSYRVVEAGGKQNTWDDVLRKSTQEYQHHSYNILTCNCHSFVANNLNRLEFQGGGWNVVNVAVMILMKGKWVGVRSMIQSYLPFVVVFFVGVMFGGYSFVAFLGLFGFVLVGWYLLGTYCFRHLIKL